MDMKSNSQLVGGFEMIRRKNRKELRLSPIDQSSQDNLQEYEQTLDQERERMKLFQIELRQLNQRHKNAQTLRKKVSWGILIVYLTVLTITYFFK